MRRGMSVAAVVAFFGITLGQSLVAVGFVLTLMARDLAYFLGNPYARVQGLPGTGPCAHPLFERHSGAGRGVFQPQPAGLPEPGPDSRPCGGIIYRTPMGLTLRATGRKPRCGLCPGHPFPERVQFAVYTMAGGVLVGLAGATFCPGDQTRLGPTPGG